MAPGAIEAGGVSGVAVQFHHRVSGEKPEAWCRLSMFWCDHSRDFPGPMQARQRRMAAPGPRCGKLRVHGEPSPPDSLRISALAMNVSNPIGWYLVHMPPGERKSGMPHSVEMPAPVKGMMTRPTRSRDRVGGDWRSRNRLRSCSVAPAADARSRATGRLAPPRGVAAVAARPVAISSTPVDSPPISSTPIASTPIGSMHGE